MTVFLLALSFVSVAVAVHAVARWQGAERVGFHRSDIIRLLQGLLAEERERNEYLGRLLDQYRADGSRAFVPPYKDEGPPLPAPLPKECEDWLLGLDEGVREEFEEMVRRRLDSGDSPDEAIARVTGFV